MAEAVGRVGREAGRGAGVPRGRDEPVRPAPRPLAGGGPRRPRNRPRSNTVGNFPHGGGGRAASRGQKGGGSKLAHWLVVLLVVRLAPASGAVFAQAPAVDLEGLLARIGGRLERHFQRSQSLVSTETVSVRSFDRAMRSRGRPRRLAYQRHVEWDAAAGEDAPSVRIARELLSVNGRPPGPEDEDACLAPETEDDDPLSLLLPARQVEFDFRLGDVETVDGRPVARLSFTPTDVQRGEIEWEGDCVSIDLEGWYGGSAWVDVESGEVLRLDRRLTRPFEFREPADRPGASRRWNRLERDDSSIRYERIVFEDPDETLMLPRSIEHNWSIEGGGFVPRYFRMHRFSNYRRFVTGGRLVAPGTR